MVPAGTGANGRQLLGILHHRRKLGGIAPHQPVELTAIMGGITLVGIEAVDDDAKTEFRHLANKAFREALVRGVAVIDQKNDLDVASAQRLPGEIQETVTIGILQADLRKGCLGGLQIEGIIDRGVAVIEAGAGGNATGIDRRERPLHQRVTYCLAVNGGGHGLAEHLVSVQLANGLPALVRIAPAIGGEIHLQIIADEPRPEGKARRRIGIGGAFQRGDEIFRLLEVGKIARSRHGLHITVGPGGKLVMDLVEIGQLLALLIDLPVIGVAPQHDDIIGTVRDRHPRTHDRHVHKLGRKGVLELVIGVFGIFRMLRFQNMRRSGAEARIGHGVEILLGKGALEGPFHRIIIDLRECRSLTEGFGRCTPSKRRNIGIDNGIFPVEHHVIGIEWLAVGPFGALDEMHGQLVAVFRPFPAFGEIGQRFGVLGIHLK